MMADSLPITIFPVSSTPFGSPYSEWVVRWWQWLLSIPKPLSPALDWTGSKASVNQHDPNVFFLCQTVEGVEFTPVRRHLLNSKKAILIPVINWISTMDEDGKTDEELLNVAKRKMDVVNNLEVSINKIRLSNLKKYRVKSSFFDVTLPHNNIFDLPPGRRRSVTDGYWLFFKPLESSVEILTCGSCSSGVTRLRVCYELSVPREQL
jgi:hypothetical protein